MFESVLKACCEIVEYGWTKDSALVNNTFITGLAKIIRDRNDYEEEVGYSFSMFLSPSFAYYIV